MDISLEQVNTFFPALSEKQQVEIANLLFNSGGEALAEPLQKEVYTLLSSSLAQKTELVYQDLSGEHYQQRELKVRLPDCLSKVRQSELEGEAKIRQSSLDEEAIASALSTTRVKVRQYIR
jgi:hypothetical protein